MSPQPATPSLSTSAPGSEVLPHVLETDEALAIPRYNIVLLDDNDHTYEYVIEMLSHLFGHSMEVAYQMAVTVDRTGRVIVDTTHRERAELKRDQIRAYGPDWRILHSKASMGAVIEPVNP